MTNAWPPPPPQYGSPFPQAPRRGPSTAALVIGGAGLFIAGAIASFVGLAIIGVLLGSTTDNAGTGVHAADVRTYGPGGDLEAFALAPGQCGPADLDDVAAIPEGTNVDCTSEHIIEAYATLQPPGPAAEPTAAFEHDDLAGFADQACYVAFAPYVKTAYADSDLDYLPVMPSRQAWSAGARTITCVLFHYDGNALTETARDSNS
ncbi:MAG: hypothetical protein QOF60_2057 [Actinomycetota bacterium]|jgi:hypothetical protein|nr:hypothetical protein [Actinomycetota bacterium]